MRALSDRTGLARNTLTSMLDRMEAADLARRVPDADDRTRVHDVIYDELCRGVIRDASREVYRHVMDQLVARGAEAIILGCTEISLLVGPQDARVPLFDTTALHASAAVEAALAD